MTITACNLKKQYQNRLVVDIDELTLKSGKIYALMGPNGSGKSTLLRIVAGIEKPDSGKVLFNSEIVEDQSALLAYMPQKPYLFSRSVYENSIMGISNMPGQEELALEAIKDLDLLHLKNKNARTLSGGEAQRLALLRTLLVPRQFYILDEPFSAQDPHHLRLSEEFTRARVKAIGATLLFTTHNQTSADYLSDTVLELEEGRLVTGSYPSV